MQGWNNFKVHLLGCFCHTQEGTLWEQFLSLKQEGTIWEYLQAFGLLAATLEDVLEYVQESTFINGGKPAV